VSAENTDRLLSLCRVACGEERFDRPVSHHAVKLVLTSERLPIRLPRGAFLTTTRSSIPSPDERS
jgi:hypothetical protein